MIRIEQNYHVEIILLIVYAWLAKRYRWTVCQESEDNQLEDRGRKKRYSTSSWFSGENFSQKNIFQTEYMVIME